MLEATVDMEALLDEGWRHSPDEVEGFKRMVSVSRSFLENPDTPFKGNYFAHEGLEPAVSDWWPIRALNLDRAWQASKIYGGMLSFNDVPPRVYKGDWEKYQRIVDNHHMARDTAMAVACSAYP